MSSSSAAAIGLTLTQGPLQILMNRYGLGLGLSTEGNRRASRELGLLCSHSHGEAIAVYRSPIGDAFRRRLRMFPSLVNCCTIDWFICIYIHIYIYLYIERERERYIYIYICLV